MNRGFNLFFLILYSAIDFFFFCTQLRFNNGVLFYLSTEKKKENKNLVLGNFLISSFFCWCVYRKRKGKKERKGEGCVCVETSFTLVGRVLVDVIFLGACRVATGFSSGGFLRMRRINLTFLAIFFPPV